MKIYPIWERNGVYWKIDCSNLREKNGRGYEVPHYIVERHEKAMRDLAEAEEAIAEAVIQALQAEENRS